jgi:hypothetical protein
MERADHALTLGDEARDVLREFRFGERAGARL